MQRRQRSRVFPPRRIITATLFVFGLASGFFSGISQAHSGFIRARNCRALFSTPFHDELPPALAFDPSLVALKQLYEDQIEIEDHAEGPRIYLHAGSQTRDISKIDQFSIGTYNVLNFLEMRGKYSLDLSTGKTNRIHEPIAKADHHLIEQGKILFDENNDILFTQEVESLDAAQVLNHEHMQGMYQPILIGGNDVRGINIALFFKKDLPFDIEIQSHRNLSGDYLGVNQHIFSRDLPVVLLRRKGSLKTDPPFLILMGKHLKSKRDALFDPESQIRRELEVRTSLKIKEKFEAAYPKTPILTLGDFNGDLRSDQILAAYWDRGQMKDSFELAQKSVPKENRITHTYHPWIGATVKTQLDGILVSRAGQADGLIYEAKIVRYLDRHGNEKPIPETRIERDENPSDHFMVSTRWNFKKLFALTHN